MNGKLPEEILYRISKLVGEESTLDLKPCVLVDRQWHATVAPTLLSAISISSLGNLVEFCDQIIECYQNDNTLQSSVAKYTKIIVVSGKNDEEKTADSYLELEGFGEQARGEDETPDYYSLQPDIEMEPDLIRDKVRAAISKLTILDGFEWYGRFAGDYHLARYLQQAGLTRHLAYGIDLLVSRVSQAYQAHAFTFEGLETLSITFEYESDSDFFSAVAKMMRRNPNLRSILFDCKFIESMSGWWSLIDFICDTSSPDQPTFVWPNLSFLFLRFWKGDLWQSAEDVELLAKFLVAHPKLETLVLQETCLDDSESETAKQLSLAKYPESLPVLKRLLGSPRLIAGVLESRAACLSVERVIDNSEGGLDSDGAKAHYIDRIMNALENTPENQVKRLQLEVPQLSRDVYARIARIAPRIRFLEFLRPFDSNRTTPNTDDFDPQTDIPAALNNYPNLEIVGAYIASDLAKALDCSQREAIVTLAKQVPKLKAAYDLDEIVNLVHRQPNGDVSVVESTCFLSNEDFDWMTFDTDWRHRSLSRREIKKLRGLEASDELVFYSYN